MTYDVVSAPRATVEIEVASTVPDHGTGAAAEPGFTDGFHLTVGLAESLAAVVRTSASLGLADPAYLGDPRAPISRNDRWSEAVGRCTVLVDGASEIVLRIPGEGGGALTWTLRELATGVAVELRTSPGRWYREALAALRPAVVELVRRVAADGDPVLGALDGMDRAAWHRQSVGPEAQPLDTCLLAEVVDQARRRPDAVAVRDASGVLTFAQLLREVERIAALLVAGGAVAGDLVALELPRGRDLVAAMLGAWRARCAFVALDPADTAARRAHVLDVASPALLLTIGRSSSTDTDLPVVDLCDEPTAPAAGECCRPLDNAYVMFTSGSTGAPKGATVAHDGMLNHARAKLDDLGFTEADVMAQTGPISFDIVVWQCVAPLIRGGRTEVLPDEDVRDPRRTLAALEEKRVTVWQALPAVIRACLDTSGDARPALASLRWIVPTGDALPSDLCHSWLGAYPRILLLNTYGSTECSDDQCHHVVDKVRVSDPPVMFLGRPIPGMSALVLDLEGRVVPPGVPGELHIGGVGVGPGYWNRPDLTEQRFVHLPTQPELGRLYRSGDLARRHPDGTLEFLSRVDDTVKVRGRRIETALVEEAVRRHPEVSDCAVVGHRSALDITDARLVAFVVAPTGVPADLVEHVADLLDEHHVPDHVTAVERLPLSANGKVDRAALERPSLEVRGGGSSGLRPGVESSLAGIWSDVLGVADIGPDDDFFALGGHSLAVGRILGRVGDDLGVDLPMSSVYDHPTVRTLAVALSQPEESSPRGSGRIEVADGVADVSAISLTDLQQAYWVGETDFLDGGGMRAHVWVALDTRDLDVERLGRAVDAVVARHTALRAVVDDGVQRVLHDVPRAAVEHIVTDDAVAEEHEIVRSRLLERFRDEGPSTSAWPLFDLAVLERNGAQTAFFSISLLVADATSEALLVRDLVDAYADDVDVDVDETRAPTTRYADVLHAVAETQARPDEADVLHWQRALEDLPAAPVLPWGAPGGEPRTFTRRAWALEAEEWGAFRARAARHGLTPTAALFAAYCSMLRRWSKTSRFTVNTLASLRLPLDAHAHHLVGNLSSTIPSVVDLGEPEPFADVARRLQRTTVLDLEHARLSGVSVVRRLAAERGWSESGALPVVFASTLDVTNPALDDLPVTAQVAASGVQTPHVLLDHQVYEYGGRFHAVFDSVDAAFRPDVVDAMVDAHRAIVRSLADSDDAWLDVAHRGASPAPSGAVPLVWGSHGVLHAPVVERAGREPDAVAVVDPSGTTLTYGALLARAQQVAGALVERGVGRGDLVPHLMVRGWEQVVAILGTHLAGAAYLPIDAALPDDRIDYLVGQATVPVVLAQTGALARLTHLGHTPFDVSACTDSVVTGRHVDGGARPDDIAYVIFTSGSTGLPKGVTIDHRGAVNTVVAINEQVGLDRDDVVLGLSSTSFDLSVWDVFGTLSAGGTLVLLSPGEYRDPAHWHDMVGAHGVTVWNSVPALLDLYVGFMESGFASPLQTSLRWAMLSGDWIPVPLADRARAVLPGLEVLSLGGATEASIWSIQHPIGVVDPAWASIPYGTALPGQGMHVVDDQLDVRPDHVVGEICISGVGLALGYWQDAERTAERFVHHGDTGLRLYRTGDLGVRRPDGTIEFLGREDNQVKIQGHRVELGEIEAVLATHPAVASAVVVARQTDHDGKVLAAYVVTDDADSDLGEVRAHAAAGLPAYMVPHALTRIDRLPLTSNGKVDRRALPDLAEGAVAATGAARASLTSTPAVGTEASILDQMREVLGMGAELGVEDSFFAAGGNSFAAMRLVGRLRSRLGIDVRLARVFDAGSARGLAAVVGEDDSTQDEVVVPLRPMGGAAPVFLAHPVGGSVAAYADLLRALDPDRPVFGLQAGHGTVHTLRELASTYADAVERTRPVGPLVLGGWSMGGLLAHEVALVLRGRGRDVEAVLVIDSTPEPERKVQDDLAAGFLFDVAGGREVAPASLDDMRVVAAGGPGAPDAAAALMAEGLVPSGADEVVLRERYDIFARNATLLRGHVAAPCPPTCDTPTVVVHGGTSHLETSQTRDAWLAVCPASRPVAVAGDHYTVVTGTSARVAAYELESVLGGVVDDLPGGVRVHDDHRWMEDWRGERFAGWIHDQGRRTAQWLDEVSGRADLAVEIQALVDGVAELTSPQAGGPHVFALLRGAGDVTPRLVRSSDEGEWETVLDTSELDDGLRRDLAARSHVSVDWFTPSPTGDHVAVALSVDGSEEATMVVVGASGSCLPGLRVSRVQPMRINRATVGGAAWSPDGSTVSYLRLPDVADSEGTARYQGAAACLRSLGTPGDEVVVASRQHSLGPGLDPDDLPLLSLVAGDRALLTVAHASARERSVFVADSFSSTAPRDLVWHPLARPHDRVHAWSVRGDELYTGRVQDDGWTVERTCLRRRDRSVQVCSAVGSALEDLVTCGGHVVVRALVDGAGAVGVLPVDEGPTQPRWVSLDGHCGVAGVVPRDDGTVEVLLSSWTRPSRLVRIDLGSGHLEERWSGGRTPDPGIETVVEQVTASDGAQVPVTLVRAVGSKTPAPVWLTAYGFFGITLRPLFTPLFVAWLRRGGVVAIAHVRGGGDRGDGWYRAGHREHTGVTVQDLLDVSRHLSDSGLSAPDLTIAEGTSAGGLTVGGAMARDPRAFAGVVMRVSLTNPLRLEMHENGPPNVPEYGTIGTVEGVQALCASEVYHRVDPDAPHPPVLLTMGLRDPRVLPWQPAKLAARLQRRDPDAARIRVEEHGGHGLGAATSQAVAETVDRLCFALDSLRRRHP